MASTSDTPALSTTALSKRARSVWAKSWPNPAPDGVIEQWLPLYQHLADTAAAAGLVWDQWLAPPLRRMIIDAVGDEAAARSLIVWLAAAHDVGKASPAFAVQVPRLTVAMTKHGLHMDPKLAESEERRVARHELVSHLAVTDWLTSVHGFSRSQATKIGSVLAAHHGRPASRSEAHAVSAQSRLLGDEAWRATREELLHAAVADTASTDDIASWRTARLSQRILILLSALVIIADWIASNDALFPLVAVNEAPSMEAEVRAAIAWERLDLPRPWVAAAPENDQLLFRQRFNLPSPRPVQAEIMRLARECPAPCLLVLEAEMGIGKTEAALAAAEILATRFGLSGVFVGLPTQATADGMFARVVEWAQHLALTSPINIHLGHGKSSQNETFDRMSTAARFRSIGDRHQRVTSRSRSEESWNELVIAHHWFGSPKRGPLSNLVVGTIDQALMGALRSKHLMLRHLALAGKVVILDEVHAYDAFMSQYLERVLHWLGIYHVPVIMLSATLPAAQRRAFVAAYDSGRARQADAPEATPARGLRARKRAATDEKTQEQPLAALDDDIGYPSIVMTTPAGLPHIVRPEHTSEDKTIILERLDDDLSHLAQLLDTALSEGGTAVVIRNTVRRVQETAAYLRKNLSFPVEVTHSRFLARDRAEKDRELLRRFGKDSADRPTRMVVVASQVVEQSLDIDFDIMISDLAPIDLLLQRAGRLHRHRRPPRPRPVNEPRFIIAGADWTTSPPDPARGSKYVYAPYILLRTLAALNGRVMINLPADIPTLVQSVYGEAPLGPESWASKMDAAREDFIVEQTAKRAKADVFRLPCESDDASLLGWLNGSAGDPATDSFAEASVRDSDETLEVIVVQEDTDGILRTPDWLNSNASEQIPDNEPPDHALTRTILGCTLRLPMALCAHGRINAFIRELEELYPVTAWHGSHALRGELVLVFDEYRRATLSDYDLHYDPADGLSYALVDDLARAESEQLL